MMIDILYFAACIYVVAALAQVVRTTWAAHSGDMAIAVHQDRAAFVWPTLAYLAITIGILVVTLA